MFKLVEIVDQLLEGGTASKITNRSESNSSSHGRKCNGGESASPTNPVKGRAVNFKKNHAGHPNNGPDVAKNTCLLHVPSHSTEEFKVLKEYSQKYAVQRPHN